MSSSSTIRASSPCQTVLDRLSNVRLPSPAIVVALLIACVFLLRLPSALVPREFNADESHALSQAMKFLVDPRPWKAADGGTWGPLNSYLVSIPLLMGFKPGFILVHMLASVLVCLQVLTAYLTLRRLKSEKTAALGAFLMVLLYGFTTDQDYLHYAGEWLPSLLLMVGFYIFLVWLDEPAGRRPGAELCLLFSGGLALGTAPWCKLQAAPIAGALGLVVMAAILRNRGRSFSFSWRVKELIAFCAGAVLTTCVMLAILAKTGAIEDFWNSYILNNLAYAGPQSLTRSMANLVLIFLFSPLQQLLLVGIGLLVYVSRSDETLPLFKKHRWALSGLLVYAGGSLFAVCRVQYLFLHHAILLVPPMTYMVAGVAPYGVTGVMQSRQSPQRLTAGVLLVLLVATIALYVAHGVRYVYMIKAIPELSHSQPDSTVRIPKVVPDLQKTDSNGGIAKFLALYIRPRHWELPDSNERIFALVRDIQKTRPVRSLAIWGYAPGVYVLTGIPPATRDSSIAFVISPGPMQKYYRARFVGDLRAKPPDLFIDAVAPDASMWPGWSENDGYESDPQLRKFIEDNYILVDQLTLVKGAKPVRFFARRGSASQ